MHRNPFVLFVALAAMTLPSTAMAAFHNGAPTFTNPFAVEVYHLFYWSFATAGIVLGHLFTGNVSLIAYDLQLFAGICGDHSPLVGGILFGTPLAMLATTIVFFTVLVGGLDGLLRRYVPRLVRHRVRAT